jgi:hypothetical protein
LGDFFGAILILGENPRPRPAKPRPRPRPARAGGRLASGRLEDIVF